MESAKEKGKESKKRVTEWEEEILKQEEKYKQQKQKRKERYKRWRKRRKTRAEASAFDSLEGSFGENEDEDREKEGVKTETPLQDSSDKEIEKDMAKTTKKASKQRSKCKENKDNPALKYTQQPLPTSDAVEEYTAQDRALASLKGLYGDEQAQEDERENIWANELLPTVTTEPTEIQRMIDSSGSVANYYDMVMPEGKQWRIDSFIERKQRIEIAEINRNNKSRKERQGRQRKKYFESVSGKELVKCDNRAAAARGELVSKAVKLQGQGKNSIEDKFEETIDELDEAMNLIGKRVKDLKEEIHELDKSIKDRIKNIEDKFKEKIGNFDEVMDWIDKRVEDFKEEIDMPDKNVENLNEEIHDLERTKESLEIYMLEKIDRCDKLDELTGNTKKSETGKRSLESVLMTMN
ncbi:hypothetical protein AGMMS49531_09800 [Endomicrobiia bacterium]|nr:hypothetical protein AGMMS49531_09800 [Endomicrobiia bacterium]